MNFLLSKLLWILVEPTNFLVLALALGVYWRGYGGPRLKRLGDRMTTSVTVILCGLLLFPVDIWLIQPLERQFPIPTLPAQVNGIIVLGGMIDTSVSKAWGQPKVNHLADRLIEFVDLARRYPEAKLIFSGGSGSITTTELTEAAVAREVCARLGLAPQRISFEDRSRNTYENVEFSFAIAQPKPGENWVLITSATHMPRAVGIFRKIGWPVIPYPVSFLSAPPDDTLQPPLDVSNTLFRLDGVTHEWIGLLAYHLMGRTSAWLPGQ